MIHPPTSQQIQTAPPTDPELDVLLAEYQSGREDERHSLTQQVVLVGAGAASVVAALAQGDLGALDDRAKLLLVVIGLAFGSYTVILFANVTLRNIYQRLIENAIAEKVDGTNLAAYLAWPKGATTPVLSPPALSQLGRALQSRRYGSRRIRAMNVLFFVAMLISLAGALYAIVWSIKDAGIKSAALATVTFYSLLAVAVMWTTTFNSEAFVRRRFRSAARSREDSRRQKEHAGADRKLHDKRARTLLGYLLLPRVSEAFKSTYYIAAAGVGLLLYPGAPYALSAAALMWVALEPLAYQARYVWNDLRDADEDDQHWAKAARGRIPVPHPDDQHAVFGTIAVMMVLRFCLAATVVAFVVPARLRVSGLVVLGLLIGITLCYESLRTLTKGRFARNRPGVIEWLVYVVVGLGYGLRAGAGIYFGSGGTVAPEVLSLVIGTFSLLGMANCMTVWLLEVSTGSEQANPAIIEPYVKSRSHVWSLRPYYKHLNWTKINAELARQNAESQRIHSRPSVLGSVAVLAPRDVLRFPGFAAYALAMALSSQLGLVLYSHIAGTDVPLLATTGDSQRWQAAVLWSACSVLLLIVLALIPTSAGWLVGLGIPLVVAVATAAPAMDLELAIPLAPVVFVTVVYLLTRSSSYEAHAAGWLAGLRGLARIADYGILALAQHTLREKSFDAVFERGAARLSALRAVLDSKYRNRLWPRHTIQFAMCSAALWAGFMGPQLVLLPKQIQEIAGPDKAARLGPILAAGALTALVANVAAGALSDRLRAKVKVNKRPMSRRPMILVGAVGGAGSMLLLRQAVTLEDVFVGWVVMQFFLNIMLSGTLALIPDHVPSTQRGAVSGLFGAMQIGGSVLGGGLAVALPSVEAYSAIAGLLVFLPWPLLAGWRAGNLPKLVTDKATVGTASRRNLAWAFATRFTVQFAITLGTAYLLFYLTDKISDVRPPELALIILTALLGLALASTALVVGSSSDNLPVDDLLQKRKPYIFAAGFVVAAGTLTLAFVPTWPAVTLAAATIGVGFGLFATADLALNTHVLTSSNRYGVELGLLNIGNSLPQVFGALVTASVVTTWGYESLYVAAAAAALAGCLFIRGVKTRKVDEKATPALAQA